MYKPLQKKSSSWASASIQKKSKNFSKPGSSAIQQKPNSQEIPNYSTTAADLLAANVMRSLENKEQDEPMQMSTPVQRVFQGGGIQASGDLESRLNASQSGGNALAPEVRAFMEPRFGADFSAVRVHTGGEAVQMNRELGAQAFTHGSNIYFGEGKSPGSNELTAHELTHVVQQTGAVQRLCSECESELSDKEEKQPIQTKLTVREPGDKYEQEADAVAAQVVDKINAPTQEQPVQRRSDPKMRITQQPEANRIQRYESGEHAELGETGLQIKQDVAGLKQPYKVKKGETLKTIAEKFGVPTEELKAYNKDKLKSWAAKDGSGRKIEGFSAGETIIIPPHLTDLTKEAASGKDLTFTVNGVKITYGEGIAMGDFFKNPTDISTLPKAKLEKLVNLIKQERAGKPVSTEEWQEATNGRYLELAQDNESHFAPSNANLVSPSGKSSKDHKSQWENYHLKALQKSQAGERDLALQINAFADHFLTDAFAAGHIINKQDLMEQFKGKFTTNKEKEFIGNSKTFFDEVAKLSFVGDVKKTFSEYETVEYKGAGIFRPNIDSEERFSLLLQGIHQEKPDLVSNSVAKAVHDKLNTLSGGLPVENKKGDKWELSGDGTLNAKTKEIALKAVAQSQLNVTNMFKISGPVDPKTTYERVWDYVPQPTKAGEGVVKKEVTSGTDLISSTLHHAVAKLIKDNYKLILDELVKLKKLKKA